MTLQVELAPELVTRLQQEAQRRNLTLDQVTAQVLSEHLPQADSRSKAIDLLQSWIDRDDTLPEDDDYNLFGALDEARTSNRKLYPNDQKGKSW